MSELILLNGITTTSQQTIHLYNLANNSITFIRNVELFEVKLDTTICEISFCSSSLLVDSALLFVIVK